MNRLGMAQDDIPYLIDTIKAQPEIRVKSIMSHFSNADDPSMDDFTKEQFRQFEVIGNELELGLGYNFDKHICNSNAALRFPQFHSDMIRLGIGLHGMAVSEPLLQMTMKLKSYIAQIRLVEKGSLIGYGNNYKVQQDVLVGVIPIGYADGITRHFGLNGGYVSVNNQQCKVLGVVCMDMLMIDLSSFNTDDIKIGEEVEFFGEHISIAEHAQFQNTISYEVISRLSERVSRVYLRD
jgi:alanine racemase